MTAVHRPKAAPSGQREGSPLREAVRVWLPPERAHFSAALRTTGLQGCVDIFGPLGGGQSLASGRSLLWARWSRRREAHGSGALVLQLGLYNLGSTFSLFWIWVFPPYLSSPWVLLSLRPSLCLYPSAPGTAPLTLSNHVVTESGALGGISDPVPTPTSLPVSQADLAN